MWLLPAFPFLSRVAAHVYYRLQVSGGGVPYSGPVLLVANHPNSLIDPVLVVGAARRPVRFLAKAPLFSDRKIGWLVKAAGAIPVYRRQDDPAAMDQNVDMFRAVHAALGEGAAVGLFPEGMSHGDPAMAPLKTGAARIALGAAPLVGAAFPIIPVGLVFRRKDVFRSDALVIVGTHVGWEDLAASGADDREAVQDLTDRIDQALRHVTVNLERWTDRPLAECAVRMWETEFGGAPDRAARIARLETTVRLLGWVRSDPARHLRGLVLEVAAHCRRLRRLKLHPADLHADVSAGRALRWATGRAWLFLLPATLTAVAGFLLFFPPYRATGLVVDRMRPSEEVRSTSKLLVGIVLYALWVIALVIVAALLAGLLFGAVVLLAVPAAGMIGLTIRERWRGAWRDARRFFLLRSRRDLVASLRRDQEALAARLRAVYDQHRPADEPVP